MAQTVTILFPCCFDNRKIVDESYEPEFKEVCTIPEFKTAFYDHDKLTTEPGYHVKFYPGVESGPCIGRTWMMKPDEYTRFYNDVSDVGGQLINSVTEYNLTHLFPNVYPLLQGQTPKALWFENPQLIDTEIVNREFSRFIVKDYVKSVKGHDFPNYFKTPIMQADFDTQIARFIDFRQPLFTGGIVLKEFVDLRKYDNKTNEYRAFYLFGEVLSVSRNSNQPDNCPFVPMELIERFSGLPSRYYTVDFGELEDGSFTILETGDGQVSGLSPNQCVYKYYDDMRRILAYMLWRR